MDWIIAGVIGIIIGACVVTYYTRGMQRLTDDQRERLWKLETGEYHLRLNPARKPKVGGPGVHEVEAFYASICGEVSE